MSSIPPAADNSCLALDGRKRPRDGSLVLPPRPGWRDLAGRCWHARPPAASVPPTNPAPEPSMLGSLDRWPTSLAPPLAPGGLLACHGVHRPPVPRAGADRPARHQEDGSMTEASVSFAGNLTDDPEVRYTEAGIARARFRV